MLSQRLTDRLLSEVEESCAARRAAILSGGPQDYANYRESVGYLLAMEDFLSILSRIEQQENS